MANMAVTAAHAQNTPEHDFEDNGLLYSIISNDAVSVAGAGSRLATGIVIPASVEYDNVTYAVRYIADNAFQTNTELTSVTIGSSVSYIGAYAFSSCLKLAAVTSLAATPPSVGVQVFPISGNMEIYVPSTSVDLYKATNGWKDHASAIKSVPSDVDAAIAAALEDLAALKTGIEGMNVLAVIDEEMDKVSDSGTIAEVTERKAQATAAIHRAIAIYEEGYQAAMSGLPTDGDVTGNAVRITKGLKSVTLTNPDKVEFLKK